MRCKKTIDARSYSHETLEQLRLDAVKRVETGESPEAVATGLGINRRTIYRWLEAYHYGGRDALLAKAIPGAPPKLDARQMARLVRMIHEKTAAAVQV
jgi:transposase